MHIGLIGLGKMGNNMRERLRKGGVEVTGYDPNPAVTDVQDLADLGRSAPDAARRLGHGSVRQGHRRRHHGSGQACSRRATW